MHSSWLKFHPLHFKMARPYNEMSLATANVTAVIPATNISETGNSL